MHLLLVHNNLRAFADRTVRERSQHLDDIIGIIGH